MGKAGRPSKLNPHLIDKMERALSLGMYIREASALAGIGRTSFYTYLWKGSEDDLYERDTLAREFYLRVKTVLAQSEIYSLSVIAKAQEKDWRSSAWLLSHRYPQKWNSAKMKVKYNVKETVFEDSSEREERLQRISELLSHIPSESDVEEDDGDKAKVKQIAGGQIKKEPLERKNDLTQRPSRISRILRKEEEEKVEIRPLA